MEDKDDGEGSTKKPVKYSFKTKDKEKQKKLVSKHVKRLKMKQKRKVDEESVAKAKVVEEEVIKNATQEAAIKKAAELEAKAARKQSKKKANEEEPIKQAAKKPAIKKATKKIIKASKAEAKKNEAKEVKGLGFTIEMVNIEYEWKPPQCDLCKIFGHVQDHYPKKVSIPPIVDTPIVEKTNYGFQTMGKKEEEGYKPKATPNVPKKGATIMGTASKSSLSQVPTLLKNQPLKANVPPTKE
ncbi:hypothetical protein Tco_1333894, partial [Tanacetum coccineum]